MTCLDGYEMARKGRAGAALGIAGIGSFVAGTVGVIGISFLSPPLAELVIKFGPAEYAMLMLAGLTMVTYMSSGSLPRALLMAAFGLLLGTIGSDPLNMTPRLTFGILALGDGVNLVPLAIGLFGLSEVLFMGRQKLEDMKVLPPPSGLLGFLPSREEARRSVGPVVARYGDGLPGRAAARRRRGAGLVPVLRHRAQALEESRGVRQGGGRGARRALSRPTIPAPPAPSCRCSAWASRPTP